MFWAFTNGCTPQIKGASQAIVLGSLGGPNVAQTSNYVTIKAKIDCAESILVCDWYKQGH